MLFRNFEHKSRLFWVTKVLNFVNLAVAAFVERTYDLVPFLELLADKMS